MKICVLVKEVPDAAVEKRIDPSTGRMDRSGEKNLNPYDTHAIEAAMQIRDPALAGSDVAATGYALAQTLRRESPELVLLGQQSDDGECYTIGAVVAEHLGMPSLTQVIKMDVEDEGLRCERQAEYGYDTVQVKQPAVISVGDAINEPRYPSLKAIMGAKKKQLDTVSVADLQIDASKVGGDNSAAQWVAAQPPPAKAAGASIEDEATNATVEKIVAWLEERKLL